MSAWCQTSAWLVSYKFKGVKERVFKRRRKANYGLSKEVLTQGELLNSLIIRQQAAYYSDPFQFRKHLLLYLDPTSPFLPRPVISKRDRRLPALEMVPSFLRIWQYRSPLNISALKSASEITEISFLVHLKPFRGGDHLQIPKVTVSVWMFTLFFILLVGAGRSGMLEAGQGSEWGCFPKLGRLFPFLLSPPLSWTQKQGDRQLGGSDKGSQTFKTSQPGSQSIGSCCLGTPFSTHSLEAESPRAGQQCLSLRNRAKDSPWAGKHIFFLKQ